MNLTNPIHTEAVSRRCADCHSMVKGTIDNYHYTECGLQTVTLRDVLVYRCECGATVPELPSIDSLHTLIAVDLLKKQELLTGDEIRFLRKMVGLNQKELAKVMGVDPTRPSKWESGGLTIGKDSDRVLRAYCLFGMVKQMIDASESHEVVEVLAASKFIQTIDVRKVFEKINGTSSEPKSVSIKASTKSDHLEIPWLLEQIDPNSDMVPC